MTESLHLPSHGLMSLGWVLPRYRDSETAAIWTARALHLPLLRGYANAWLFWAGETFIYEPKSDGAPAHRYSDPSTSPCLPVFRSLEPAATLNRLRLQQTLVREAPQLGEAAWTFLDPEAHAICVRTSEPHLDAAERFALARAKPSQESFNPGAVPMPSDLPVLDTVIRHVENRPAMARFYTDVVGMKPLSSDTLRTRLHIGDGTVLELRDGGIRESIPADRFEVPNTIILRVADFDRYQAHLRAHEVRLVNERIQFGRGALGYFVDPEGHLIGYEERYDQEQCRDGARAFLEDLEANRRHRAAQSLR